MLGLMAVDSPDTTPQSWWWCRRCHAYVDLIDPGEPFPQCERGHRTVEYREPAPDAPVSLRELRAPKPMPALPDDAHPVFTNKRLPRDQRPTLKQMANDGFLFCLGCNEVTRFNEEECCVLCGSSQVERRPPAFPEDAP